ncbi:unnamed protein product [Lathyrus oleraceus]
MSQLLQKILLSCVLILLSVHKMLAIHVNIVNSLEDNLDLTVHCKSADDDLGIHLLHHGENYGWSFGVSVFKGTLFYCGFTWNGQLHWFDIFKKTDRKTSDCTECDWHIFKSGPCRTLTSSATACFPWNKNE